MQDTSHHGYNSGLHLRVPDDFMPRVHAAARGNGMQAASFMRKAILDAVRKLEAEAA